MTKKTHPTIKVPYSSGWVVVSLDTHKVKAHAKTFAQIVAKSEKLDPSTHAIMAAAASYHGHVMITVEVSTSSR